MTIIDPNIDILLPSETIIREDHHSRMTLSEVAHLQSRISKKQDRHDYFVPVSAVPFAFFPAADGGTLAVLGNNKVKVSQAAFRPPSAYLEISGLGKILEQRARVGRTGGWGGQEARGSRQRTSCGAWGGRV